MSRAGTRILLFDFFGMSPMTAPLVDSTTTILLSWGGTLQEVTPPILSWLLPAAGCWLLFCQLLPYSPQKEFDSNKIVTVK